MKDRGTENCVFNCDYKCQHVTQYLIEVFTVDHRTECRKTIFKTSTSLEDFPLQQAYPTWASVLDQGHMCCPAQWSVVAAHLFRVRIYSSCAFWLCEHHRHMALLLCSQTGLPFDEVSGRRLQGFRTSHSKMCLCDMWIILS